MLGPVTASVDGRAVDLRGPSATTVLAVLALNAPGTVSTERLAAAVWGHDLPGSPRKTLQAHVAKLRRALHDGAASLVSGGGGYRLEMDRCRTDVAEFRDRVRSAKHPVEWRSALDLWAGDPLGGCAVTPLVEAERVRINEEHLTAVDQWARVAMDAGDAGLVVREVEALVAEHPWHEPLWVRVVEALARDGRPRDALAAYQRARSALAEAGLEPGPVLRAAERAVLEADAPDASPTRLRTPLPAPRTRIIGREEELVGIESALDRARMVTVVGPGGSGKTTVALEAGRRRAASTEGGAVFMDLVPVTDADGVRRVLGAACGILSLPDGAAVVPTAAKRLSEAPTLLVIDNCEHVAPHIAGVLDQLLDLAPDLTVMATSRQPLELDGETVWHLGSLDDVASSNLFRERYEARNPGTIDALDADVVELCHVLEGLPLAIELAAANTGHLSVREVADAIAAKPHELRRPGSGDGRHASIEATIRWSHDLLDEGHRRRLRSLSVFRSAFDRDQATAVIGADGDPSAVTDVLGELVSRSLVVAETGDQTTSYRLLDSIRSFAWDQAHELGEAEDLLVRHRNWYLAEASSVPACETAVRMRSAQRLRRHHADLVLAMETSAARSDHDALARLSVWSSGLLFCPGGHETPERWVDRALTHVADISADVAADLYGVGATTALLLVSPEEAVARIVAGADVVLEHRTGAGPLLFVMTMAIPFGVPAVAEQLEVLLADLSDLHPDVELALRGMHPWQTALTVGIDEAVEEADDVWRDRTWSDEDNLATWAVHAALLHVAGHHHELAARMESIERTPGGPDTPFLTVFGALARAGTGDPGALAPLASGRRMYWTQLPGIENDLLIATAAITAMHGDHDTARRLFETPGLWARHPSTGLVQLHHRRNLGLDPPVMMDLTAASSVSTALDEVFAT